MTRRILIALVCASGLLAAQELPLDQLLQKHYAAMGGLDNMRAIKSLTGSGKASLMGGQLEMTIALKTKRPNMVRQDMTMQGRAFVQSYDGTTAWSINPMASPEPTKMGETEAMQVADSADIDGPLVDFKEKGHTLELQGKEDLEGSPAYKLKVTRKNGRTETYFIDAAKFLIVKSVGKVNMGGQEMEVESLPSNYKAINGVMMPFSVEQRANKNAFLTLTMDSFTANKEIPDADFKMPAPAPAPEKK
jgi:outer membrane lipoprotein-sorting protein